MKNKVKTKKLFRGYYIFIRDFISALFEDKLSYYSSSLSFYTLFSIIPLLVIVLSIFTNLPIFESIYQEIESMLFENLMPTHSKEILTYINGFVENSAKLGVVGMVYVLFAGCTATVGTPKRPARSLSACSTGVSASVCHSRAR